MKPYLYFYSKQQAEIIKETPLYDFDGFACKPHINEVFVNGEFIRYTEKMQSGSSNFDDAVFLGVLPQWWTRHNGRVQCEGLSSFLLNNERE